MKKITTLTLSILLFSFTLGFSQGKWTTYTEELDAGAYSSGNITHGFAEDKAGNIILGCSKGKILRFNGNDWKSYLYMVREKKAGAAVFAPPVADNSSGYVWFGGSTGIILWDGSEPYVMTGSVDKMSRMLYGDTNSEGFTFFNNEKTIITGDEDVIEKFPAFHIYSALVDSKNRVWMGNLAGRLFIRTEDGVWTEGGDIIDADIEEMTKRNPLLVHELFEDKDNNIWVLTNSCVAKFDPDLKFSVEKSLVAPSSIFQDSKGDIWIGYVGGIARYNGSTWEKWEKDEKIEDVVFPGRFLEDKDGNIWFCSKTILATRKGGGLFKYDGNRWASYKLEKKGYMADILIDKSGDLWCATITGIYRYKDDEWNNMRKAEGFAKFYQEVFEDSKGNIWFGMSSIKGSVERYTP